MAEATMRIEVERPLTPLEQAGRVIAQVQERRAENDTSEQRPEQGAAPVILPQEPDFLSTFAGCCAVFFGLFFGVSWGVVGPAMWIGLAFSWPNFAAVVAIIGASAWMIGYWWYIHRIYYPGRPFVPILLDGQPQVREVGERQWVFAQRECGLPRIWEKRWCPIEFFVLAVEEGE